MQLLYAYSSMGHLCAGRGSCSLTQARKIVADIGKVIVILDKLFFFFFYFMFEFHNDMDEESPWFIGTDNALNSALFSN